MKPGVFISHKLDDAPSDAFLRRLRPELEAIGAHVWIDTDIAAGEVWRNELSTWMSLCRCAVLVISRKALESDWVFQEASILSWRQEQDRKFKLLPVVLEGLTDDEIGASRLKAVVEILRLQSPARKADETGKLRATVEAVRSQVEAQQQEDNVYVRTAREISKLLDQAQVDDASMQRTAGILNVDLGRWIPGWRPSLVLALTLLTAGPQEIFRALEEIEVAREIKSRIGKLVLPFWVDMRAAEIVRRVAQASGERPLMLLNAAIKDTVDDYVRRAAFSPNRSWRAHHLSDVFGESYEGDLWHEVCVCIWRGSGGDESVVQKREELHRRVESFLKLTCKTAPQFVTIGMAEERFWAGFEKLRREHRDVVYLLRCGRELPGPAKYHDSLVEVVKPELDGDLEQQIDGLRTYFNQSP